MLRVLADPNIPLVETYFGALGSIAYFESERLPQQILDCDILVVRSTVRVDAALLGGSNVRLVVSATSGVDHVDQAYLEQSNIGLAHARGANAGAVADYVLISGLYLLGERARVLGCPVVPSRTRVGIVGYGHVGRAVAACFSRLGFACCFYDPYVSDHELPARQVSRRSAFEQVIRSDLVSVHTPLTTARDSDHPTYRLFCERVFDEMKSDAIFINASRGDLVDGDALIRAMDEKRTMQVALDVWPNEPDIDLELLSRVSIGTPHIAGYSLTGKLAATKQAYVAACERLGISPGDIKAIDAPTLLVPEVLRSGVKVNQSIDLNAWLRLGGAVIDLDYLKDGLRRLGSAGGSFEEARSKYVLRSQLAWSDLGEF